jgi:uncharacterized protein (DUF1697 family)
MKQTALLRGINVGGKNKIAMADLRVCFEGLGYEDVSTYVNSGNVIFSATGARENITSDIERAIEKRFDLSIPVVIRSAADIKKVLSVVDPAWKNDKTEKTDVMFLWEAYDNSKTLDLLGINPAVDNVQYVPGAIVWHLDRADYNQSAMHNLIGTKLYKHMTVRNINTVRKLAEMMS